MEQFGAFLMSFTAVLQPWLPSLKGFLFGLAAFFALNSLWLYDKEQQVEQNIMRMLWTVVASVLLAYAISVQ